jgi:hypothetical protein
MSMYPFLKDGRDSVELSGCSFDTIKKGDIVLIKRITGTYVLHRVLKKQKDCFYMIGDAQQWIEGPLSPAQLIAFVTRIKRKERIISCDNPFYKFLVSLWLVAIPFRYKIFRALRPVKRLAIKLLPDRLFRS